MTEKNNVNKIGVGTVKETYPLNVSAYATVCLVAAELMPLINEKLKEKFDFTLTTTDIKILNTEHDVAEISTKVQLDALPSIMLIANKYSGNLIQILSVKAAEIHENRMRADSYEKSAHDFMIEATNNIPYCDWSKELLDALFEFLFEDIVDVYLDSSLSKWYAR